MSENYFSPQDVSLSPEAWTAKLERFIALQQSEAVATQRAHHASKQDILNVIEPIVRNAKNEKLAGDFTSIMANKNHAHQGHNSTLRGLCEAVLRENPKGRRWLRAAAIVLCRVSRARWEREESEFARALTTGDSGLGQAASVDEQLSADIYGLLHVHSIFRTFGVVPMDGGKRKLASVTGKANAGWLTAANQGAALLADAAISGTSISPEVATVGTLVTVSGEALADGGTTFEGALLLAIVEGLGYRIDWTCLQADGSDDIANGAMTGIFNDANVPVKTSSRTSVAGLLFDDFADVIAEVDSSALQHPCAWWIHPAFLPSLLKIRVGESGEHLLKPPTGPDDKWRIHGFEVNWAAAGPDTDAVGAKVAAFGRRDAYTVGLRQDFEVASSAGGGGWATNSYLFRALARARCIMRDASSLAVLQLAAE